jgi:hypothetical protein
MSVNMEIVVLTALIVEVVYYVFIINLNTTVPTVNFRQNFVNMVSVEEPVKTVTDVVSVFT